MMALHALVEQLLGGALGARRVLRQLLDDVLDVLAADAAGVVDAVDLHFGGLRAGLSAKPPKSLRSAA